MITRKNIKNKLNITLNSRKTNKTTTINNKIKTLIINQIYKAKQFKVIKKLNCKKMKALLERKTSITNNNHQIKL